MPARQGNRIRVIHDELGYVRAYYAQDHLIVNVADNVGIWLAGTWCAHKLGWPPLGLGDWDFWNADLQRGTGNSAQAICWPRRRYSVDPLLRTPVGATLGKNGPCGEFLPIYALHARP